MFARGNDKRAIFADSRDRYLYLGLLAEVVLRMEWQCMAYCLMDNHVHLLLETPQPNLGIGMQRLHGTYARRLNDRHRRVGHVFQGRFGSVRVRSDAQLWTVVAYIARNPVEGGLCRAPGDWRWSSHRATAGGPAPRWLAVDRLLWHLAGAGGDPRRRYDELAGGYGPPPLEETVHDALPAIRL